MRIEKILLVDDDASIRRVAEISLTRVGNWIVRLADSGKSALATVADFRPDVILLDVMMPVMDGVSTFKLLRDHDAASNTPVIFLTAKVQKQEVQSYYDIGAAGVIIKPFDPLILPSDVQRIVNNWEGCVCA